MESTKRIGVLIDYETRSRVDIKIHGNSRYVRDSSTEIMCLCAADVYFENNKYTVDRKSKRVWDFRNAEVDGISDYLPHDGEIMYAFNAGFEYLITTYILGFKFPIENVYCLQHMALYNGLPASLDAVSKAVPLKSPKDEQGHRLMLRMCKPDKTGEFPYNDEMQDRLIQYCHQDIEAEAEILEELMPIPEYELKSFHETFRMNIDGLPVDTQLTENAMHMVSVFSAELKANFPGINLRSPKQIIDFAKRYGYTLVKTDKEHVAKALQDPLCPKHVKAVLEVKSAGVGSSSVSKFDSIMNFTDTDGRVRNAFRHHGAVRTGRWTSQGVQLQNLPRGEKDMIKILPEIRDYIRHLDFDSLYLVSNGKPIDALRTAIRSMFAPDGDNIFVQRDLSAIEARGAFWFAGARELRMFFDFDAGVGEEPYMIFANALGMDRFAGKQGILSTNYGIGWKTLQRLCEVQGKKISDTEAQAIINLHRELFPEVKNKWYEIDSAVKECINNPNVIYCVKSPTDSLKFIYDGNLRMKLPSGRVLTYWDAKLQPGQYGLEITYMTHGAENGKAMGWHRTRTWGGGIFGHVVQGFSACIMRDIAIKMTEAGMPASLLVHDEAVTITNKNKAQLVFETMGEIMKNPPAWAKGLPVQSAGWIGDYYRKD